MQPANSLPRQLRGESVPPGWDVAALVELAVIAPGRGTDSSYDGNTAFLPMELIPAGRVFADKWQLRSPSEIRSGVHCRPGDLLLPKITPSFENGKQCIVPSLPTQSVMATTEVFPIRPDPHRLDTQFLFYFLLLPDVRREIASRMEGTTGRQRIPRAVIEGYPVPLPPLLEQRTIAGVLSTVRRAIEATEAVIEAAQALQRSLALYLFTYGPVPAGSRALEELVEGKSGMRPCHWAEVPLWDIVTKTATRDPRKHPDHIVKYVDVSSISSSTLRVEAPTDIRSIDAPSRARKVLAKGDVIFATVRPALRRIAMIPKELDGELCSTAFCVIRARADFAVPSFLFYSVSDPAFVRSVAELQRGSSYPAVTDSDVMAQSIRLPPFAEQERIGSILSNLDRKLFAEVSRKQSLEALLSALSRDLLTGQLRVRPGPPNA